MVQVALIMDKPSSSSKGNVVHVSSQQIRQQINDEATIARFGKQQKFKRNFRIVSTIGLSAVVGLTWESVLGNLASLLINGGPAGAFGEYIFSFFGTFSQVLVMAEVASMIPLSGGPYNWVSILAPPRFSKCLSYITGWLTILAWQAIIAGTAYSSAAGIEALVFLDDNSYNPHPWRAFLLYFAFICVALFVNTVLGSLLPMIDSLVLMLHVFGFFVVIFLLAYLPPKNSAEVVFGTFLNVEGWSTNALSFMVGSATCMATFAGADAASHMAEEVEDAARTVPKAMIFSIILNGITGVGMLIAVLFAMGSPDQVLGHQSWYPIAIPLFNEVTGSTKATTAIIASFTVISLSGIIAGITAGSRMIWAFARENALPLSSQISKVNRRLSLPINAIAVSVIFDLLLGLIILGSTTVFNAFVGLIIATFYSTYFLVAMLSIGKRLFPQHCGAQDLEWGPFTLGRWGVPVAAFSMAYSAIGWFFSFFPPGPQVNAQSFNWSSVIYTSVVLLAIVWWMISARHKYSGPRATT